MTAPAGQLADRLRQWLLYDQGVTEAQAGAIVLALRDVLRDALAWRSYWHPDEHAARAEAELAAQRELQWAMTVDQVRRLAGRVARGETVPPAA